MPCLSLTTLLSIIKFALKTKQNARNFVIISINSAKRLSLIIWKKMPRPTKPTRENCLINSMQIMNFSMGIIRFWKNYTLCFTIKMNLLRNMECALYIQSMKYEIHKSLKINTKKYTILF